MTPFQKDGVCVDSEFIRGRVGDFRSTELIRWPSKYAARLAQAFISTKPSVKIGRHQWEQVSDLGSKPYLFTDGIGTISKALGDRIWERLEGHEPNTVQSSVVSRSHVPESRLRRILTLCTVYDSVLGLQRHSLRG